MDDSENKEMELKIGGIPIKVNVPFSRQDFIRDVEEDINKIYSKWRVKYNAREDLELLAMLVYQYASHYRELKLRYEEALRAALDCEKRIDSIKF